MLCLSSLSRACVAPGARSWNVCHPARTPCLTAPPGHGFSNPADCRVTLARGNPLGVTRPVTAASRCGCDPACGPLRRRCRAASSSTDSATSRMLDRRSMDVFWIQRNASASGRPYSLLEHALGALDQLAGLSRSLARPDLGLEGDDLLVPGHGQLDRRHEVADRERLHEVGHRTRVAGPLDEVTLAEGGQHQDRSHPGRDDALGGRDPVEDRHLHVEDDEVGPVLASASRTAVSPSPASATTS